MELLTARNPDPDSRLPDLLLLPLADGMVFRTSGTWPRSNALHCYPVSAQVAQAPDAPEPSTAEVRAWARAAGRAVPARGRLRPQIWGAWRAAHRG